MNRALVATQRMLHFRVLRVVADGRKGFSRYMWLLLFRQLPLNYALLHSWSITKQPVLSAIGPERPAEIRFSGSGVAWLQERMLHGRLQLSGYISGRDQDEPPWHKYAYSLILVRNSGLNSEYYLIQRLQVHPVSFFFLISLYIYAYIHIYVYSLAAHSVQGVNVGARGKIMSACSHIMPIRTGRT
jgi:hypothetical protein